MFAKEEYRHTYDERMSQKSVMEIAYLPESCSSKASYIDCPSRECIEISLEVHVPATIE